MTALIGLLLISGCSSGKQIDVLKLPVASKFLTTSPGRKYAVPCEVKTCRDALKCNEKLKNALRMCKAKSRAQAKYIRTVEKVKNER